MRNIVTILLILTGFFIQSNAQEYTVDWGPTYRMSSGFDGNIEFLGIHGDHYYLLSYQRRAAIIEKYDLSHKLVSANNFVFSADVNELSIGGSIKTKNGSFIYLYHVDADKQEWAIYVSRFIDGQFDRPRKVYKEFFDVKNNQINNAFAYYERYGGIPLELSPDSSHVAFIDVIPSLDYKDDDVIATAVFDADMNLQWQAAWFYKFSKKDYEINQKVVSNAGEVYLVGWTHLKRRGPKRGSRSADYLPQHEYKLFKITAEDIREDLVDLGTREVPLDVKMFFSQDVDEDFLLAGFYTDDDQNSRLKGLFFSTGNTRQGILTTKTTAFKPSFLKTLTSERAVKKDKGLEMTYRIMDVLHFSDGTMGFIAEDNYDVISTSYDPYYPGYYYGNVGFNSRYYYDNTTRFVTYHSNEIIIPIFDQNGDLLNIQKIHKAYNSGSTAHTSYEMAKANDKVYLVFNDFKSKDEKEKIKKKKGRHYTDLVVLDSRGNIETHQSLFNEREIDLSFVTKWSDFNDNTLIIGSQRGRHFAFGTIQLY